jgi:hypothetical protein
VTVTRLKRKGTLALIIYFLMITALCAPLAFFAGKARGQVEAAADAPDLSQNDPDLRAEYAAHYRARRAGAGCGGESDPDIDRKGYWEIICHPYEEGAGGARIASPAGDQTGLPNHSNHARAGTNPRARGGPLEEAIVAAITGQNGPATTGLAAGGNIGSPLSLALATDGGPVSGLPFEGNNLPGSFSLSGGPNAPGGLPSNIIPDLQTAAGPSSDPSTIVTPLPGALPLLLTGLGGLFAASKRKKPA